MDGVRPSVQSAFVRGEDLTLTFNEDLETKSSPGADAFTVTEDGRGVFVWNVDVAGRQVSVRLDPPAVEGQSVTVAYAGWSRRVLDLAGNPAAGFSLSGAEVENASPAIVYDADRDGWIDISDLAQLDAIRHDLDGDGAPSSGESAEYFRAFPGSADRIYCYGGCEGYELVQDLDFDTDGSGRPGAGDAYWNGGAGWEPISEFGGLFRGNGHTISNLFIDRSGWHVGLFGRAGRWSEIEEVGLIAVDVRGRVSVGALVGFNDGSVRSSFATGRVAGDDEVGGLVGLNQGAVSDSYATGTVTHTGRGTDAGALFGVSYVRVRNSYATGPVISSDGGGLGEISSSLISASYWDRTTSGRDGGRDGGRSTFDLQAPTGSVGIYAAWSGDVWDFGSAAQYPALKADADGDGRATWQEFGYQLRSGPTLRATREADGVSLTWTAVNTAPWRVAPTVSYTVFRQDGATVEVLAENIAGNRYVDSAVNADDAVRYQVAAVGMATVVAVRRHGPRSRWTPSAPTASAAPAPARRCRSKTRAATSSASGAGISGPAPDGRAGRWTTRGPSPASMR